MTARALQPEDQIAHYRIVGPLGAGGMGEVYLAQDQTLERNVALKVLPPELVRSEERVRRFVREAKSASSLNHPNIVTIYEIGQDEVRGRDGDGDGPKDSGSSALHYISMELVSGATLTTKIHHDKTDLRTLLGYLAQAAEGLAKAHAAGIVHRDLKPSNIMVSKDGFAKILDFGLAKLTEKQSADPDVTSGPSGGGDGTSVGAIVGTVAYMSPEQVRGSAVDQRSDIFSFGTILYEATTRKKPFLAESNVETMHKILHDKPAPIEELNKEAPAELRRLIRRCLAKNPEQRLQSAKDLAIELREIVDEYDELSASGSSGSGSSALGAGPATGRRPKSRAALIGRVAVLAVAIVGSVFLFLRTRQGDQSPATPAKISAVTTRGLAVSSAMSPDGRYIAYVIVDGDQGSIWVRQLATGSDVRILGPQKVVPNSLTFTPDGSYLYYLGDDPDHTGYKALFQIPTLGGTPRKRTYDIDSRASFSPDGKQICYFRGEPQKNRDALVILDLESGKERILATVSPPASITVPEWSPDGKRIAVAETQGGVALGTTIVTYRIDDGRREPIGKEAWVFVNGLAWLPDGKGLVVCGFDRSTFRPGQLWLLTYPQGRARRITNDTDLYADPTLSGDGATIAAVRNHQESNLWIATPGDARSVRQITFGTSEEGALGALDVSDDGTIFFSGVRNGEAQIWAVGTDGKGERAVTSGSDPKGSPYFRSGAGLFYFQAEPDLTLHIWRSDADGENARQITSGKGEQVVDISPDGRTVLFSRTDVPDVLWSVSSDGGEPVNLGPSTRFSAAFSPDGSRILHTLVHSIEGRGAYTPQIISVNAGGPKVMPPFPPRIGDPQWARDGNAITYLHGANEFRNLYRLRLDGVGTPEEITHFQDEFITQHRWSPDGKRILFERRGENASNLWVVNADGSSPVAITDFETGSIATMEWTRDGSRVVFTYGESSRNVVLVKNFN